MSKIKIFVSENDIQDMQHDFKYDKPYFWATWSAQDEETGKMVDVEIYLGDESTNDT